MSLDPRIPYEYQEKLEKIAAFEYPFSWDKWSEERNKQG